MNNYFERLIILVGEKKFQKLHDTKVAIIGLGGVGGAALEVLCRSGVGRVVIVDFDYVEPSNINRQIIASTNVFGKLKTEVFVERLKTINPELQIFAHTKRLDAFNIDSILADVDFVIDAIDDINNKVNLINFCLTKKIPFISAMGMALKTDPKKVQVMKMNQTSNDPLAKALRNKLRKQEIDLDFNVVSSTETPHSLQDGLLGSYMAVTFTAGLLAADYTIKYLIK